MPYSLFISTSKYRYNIWLHHNTEKGWSVSQYQEGGFSDNWLGTPINFSFKLIAIKKAKELFKTIEKNPEIANGSYICISKYYYGDWDKGCGDVYRLTKG